MSAYQLDGTSISNLYNIDAELLSHAYDIEGNDILGGVTPSEDYDEYSNEYQYAILQARNAWATAYRADDDTVPFVLSTDQHGRLTAAKGGKALYDYLGLAVKWNEASASMNLGDTCGSKYTESTLNAMQTSFDSIPNSKQINIAGNHDVHGLQTDPTALNKLFDDYFNNSAYNDCTRFEHRGFATMIDEAHKIRYVTVGTWDYISGVYYDHRISPSAIEWLIQTLSSVDNYDVVILSHISVCISSEMMTVIYPAVDGDILKCAKQTKTEPSHYKIAIDELILARKNKTQGTYEDGDGVMHSYDFRNCTSDVLCTLNGHYHQDWYVYRAGVPSISLDAYGYDEHPFYLGLIDRTNECVKFWKIGESHTYVYTVPFEEHVNPCTAVSLNQSTATIRIGESITLTPTFTCQYQDDGTYPSWFATWRSYTTSVASVLDGVVTGLAVGTSRIRASVGSLYDECVVTVTE